jgi:hypothetical protein
MQALVYKSPGKNALEDRAKPSMSSLQRRDDSARSDASALPDGELYKARRRGSSRSYSRLTTP